ncbi:hypothetical protein RFI_30628 [Reticulomyxa filosa]|uniref:Serine/threonine-protein phosphatase n=1 Tax=Reticulomyxa filosa TaxID=46433 RepID=X6M036_RETFI|nr:hypothetical protein RFI_30628 [Reticulomyxa filosa]|eukprot:ETO06762.1 hypothetical protein RFI_30628 [Reticulomyxa filosa]
MLNLKIQTNKRDPADEKENAAKVSRDNLSTAQAKETSTQRTEAADSNDGQSSPSDFDSAQPGKKAAHILSPSNLGLKISVAGIHGPTTYTTNIVAYTYCTKKKKKYRTPQPVQVEETNETSQDDNPPLDVDDLIHRLAHFDYKHSTTLMCAMYDKKKKQLLAERGREKHEREKNEKEREKEREKEKKEKEKERSKSNKKEAITPKPKLDPQPQSQPQLQPQLQLQPQPQPQLQSQSQPQLQLQLQSQSNKNEKLTKSKKEAKEGQQQNKKGEGDDEVKDVAAIEKDKETTNGQHQIHMPNQLQQQQKTENANNKKDKKDKKDRLKSLKTRVPTGRFPTTNGRSSGSSNDNEDSTMKEHDNDSKKVDSNDNDNDNSNVLYGNYLSISISANKSKTTTTKKKKKSDDDDDDEDEDEDNDHDNDNDNKNENENENDKDNDHDHDNDHDNDLDNDNDNDKVNTKNNDDENKKSQSVTDTNTNTNTNTNKNKDPPKNANDKNESQSKTTNGNMTITINNKAAKPSQLSIQKKANHHSPSVSTSKSQSHSISNSNSNSNSNPSPKRPSLSASQKFTWSANETNELHQLLNVPMTESELKQLCMRVRHILSTQPMLLELEAPIQLVGDIHGQYYDLLRLFHICGFPKPMEHNYLFLGDYVDRGNMSLECITLLFAYKVDWITIVKYPENVFLLRGNHEVSSINRIYGFYDECKRRYSPKLWKVFCDAFNMLPVAAVIAEKIFCMHGGLSPDLTNVSEIKAIRRPTEIPDSGILCDLLWSDPDPNVKRWGDNDRGVSVTFGREIVSSFLKKNNLDLIVRAHQVVEQGYEFFADRQLVTIFSAPNYTGEFDNAAAVMNVDQNLKCSFQVFFLFVYCFCITYPSFFFFLSPPFFFFCKQYKHKHTNQY